MSVQKYRKQPVEIQAIQNTSGQDMEVFEWLRKSGVEFGASGGGSPGGMMFSIPTPEGEMNAMVGDWIIRGVEGEFYPCKDSVFQKTYEEVV